MTCPKSENGLHKFVLKYLMFADDTYIYCKQCDGVFTVEDVEAQARADEREKTIDEIKNKILIPCSDEIHTSLYEYIEEGLEKLKALSESGDASSVREEEEILFPDYVPPETSDEKNISSFKCNIHGWNNIKCSICSKIAGLELAIELEEQRQCFCEATKHECYRCEFIRKLRAEIERLRGGTK